MKELGKEERLLCELQGKIFEKSASEYGTSSAIFVRRYMNSEYAARMDRPGFADRPTDAQEAFESLDKEYGASRYGSVIYNADELFWIGYVYRYWACAYNIPSRAVYRLCNVREMHAVYYPYHTLDPMNAIERIMDAKNCRIAEDDHIAYGVQILRKIRKEKQNSEKAV